METFFTSLNFLKINWFINFFYYYAKKELVIFREAIQNRIAYKLFLPDFIYFYSMKNACFYDYLIIR